ncbi:MAG: YciI family protein [Solirubrobacteraceae bacterium]
MKFLLLINYGDAPTPVDPDAWGRLSKDEQKAVYAGYRAVTETPGVTPAPQLQPAKNAITVRVKDGEAIRTDGPLAGAHDAFSGYLFYEADTVDAAVELASRIPAAQMGGAVEVRPFLEH